MYAMNTEEIVALRIKTVNENVITIILSYRLLLILFFLPSKDHQIYFFIFLPIFHLIFNHQIGKLPFNFTKKKKVNNIPITRREKIFFLIE